MLGAGEGSLASVHYPAVPSESDNPFDRFCGLELVLTDESLDFEGRKTFVSLEFDIDLHVCLILIKITFQKASK